ncbi:energy transducer TonB [Flavobacterium franklandianum]|uniref:energy transducer TonB n=1 Tax=Flavobacterium franklandianum TaxID=2594430 RepID=UPI0021CF08E3|nr:energy transducer TonB [Flavobacterium franklandianum]
MAKQFTTPKVKGLVGKVYMSFIIEKDGSISEIKVLRDSGYGTGEEAIRVLNNSPKWLPGEQDGRKVRCAFSLPINIDTR